MLGIPSALALLEKLITPGPGLREFLAGDSTVWWRQLSKTVPAAESKRGQEKKLWSLWKCLVLSQLPGLWHVIKESFEGKVSKFSEKTQTKRCLPGFKYFLNLDLL